MIVNKLLFNSSINYDSKTIHITNLKIVIHLSQYIYSYTDQANIRQEKEILILVYKNTTEYFCVQYFVRICFRDNTEICTYCRGRGEGMTTKFFRPSLEYVFGIYLRPLLQAT